MKTMLDKIGIIGDVKTAFNRLGIETLAVVCIGGTNGTPVKVRTCDTSGGSYEDFLTLDSGHADLNKGFCFSLAGAKKFVKVVGCNVAVGIVGDCDYDVKDVVFTAVTLPEPALDNNKAATINVSTYTEPVEVTPTAGKDGMKKATITLSNIPAGGSMSQTRPEWTNLGESDTAIDGDTVVPDGVNVYYYNNPEGSLASFEGDGVTTLSAEFSGYSSKSFTFVASFGNDIAMVFNGTPDEEEENVSPEG